MSLVELLVATTLTTTVMAGVLAAIGSAQAAFVAHSETADARQRLRVGIEAITRDLLVANEALPFRRRDPRSCRGRGSSTYYARSGTLA